MKKGNSIILFGSVALLLTGVAVNMAAYPYASHAYFFGGHAALLYLFSFSFKDRRLRTLFLAGATAFVIGSLITRAHYTADVIAGFLIAAGISSWGGRYLSSWTIKTQ